MSTLTREQLEQALANAQAENAKLREKKAKSITMKVSPKGCVQVNGLRRFPVSFYPGEWATLNSMMDKIMAFANDHADEIKAAQEAAAAESE